MNPSTQNQHLSHDEILIAVVDRADLPADRLAHLDNCPSCRQELTRVTNRLTRLGRMAADMAPEPSRRFRLPERNAPSLRWMVKPSWAMAMAATLLLGITIWHPQWLSGPVKQETTVIDLSADRRLMVSVGALVDNALPDAFQQLASLSDPLPLNDESVDDDLLDWIVPPLNEDNNDDDSLS